MKIRPQQLLRRLTTDLNGSKPYDFHSVCNIHFLISQSYKNWKLNLHHYAYPFFILDKSQGNSVMSGVIEYLMEMHFALVASFVRRQKPALIPSPIWQIINCMRYSSFPLSFPQNYTLKSANCISLILHVFPLFPQKPWTHQAMTFLRYHSN